MRSEQINIMCAGFEIFALAVIAVLLATNRKNEKDRTKRCLAALTASLFAAVLTDIPTWLIADNSRVFVKVLLFLCYAFSYVGVGFFHCYLVSYLNKKAGTDMRLMYLAVPGAAVMPVLWLCSMFNGMFFTIDAAGNYSHGAYYLISQWVAALVGIVDIFLIVSCRKKLAAKNIAALLSYEILPLIAISFETKMDSVPLFAAMTISLLIIYTVVNSEQEKQLLKDNLELSEGRNALALSQIQPHFLYNSLTSIYRLCDVDPELAKKAVSDFSAYLRGNLNALKENTLISFREELRHIEAYLSLEKIRYDDYLEVKYDISVSEFFVPALAVQPLVENAVNHGIFDLPEGGCVTVATRETEDFYEISVIDNGTGFDESAETEDKSRAGIASIKNKLDIMCRGTLEIDSSPGGGTRATVRIPKGGV